jgi:multidrug efflux pump subunit AcrA (membrane-fusion protein)
VEEATMSRLRFAALSLLGSACALVLIGGQARPQDGSKKDDKPDAKPETARVEKGPLKVEAELKGVFEAEATTEVALRLEAWSQPLEVLKAVPHGATVKKGDVLVEFDPEEIDRAIVEQRAAHALAALGVELAELELPILEKFLPLDLAQAERAKENAEEDLQKFLDVDRPLSEESARFNTKSAAERLKYAAEELKQLQAMYRDKDLTEETEEMILQRQRFEVESSEFYLKQMKIHEEQALGVNIPRQEVELRDAAVRALLSLERSRSTLPLTLNQKRLALKKDQYDLARSTERLDDLRADREQFTVRAPADGVVYYGQCTNGQWSGVAAMESKLAPHGNVGPSEVILTIVQARPVFVRAGVEEKDLHKLSEGMAGHAVPAGYPDAKLPAKLAGLVLAPRGSGDFEARVSVEAGDGDGDGPAIMPGMACTVKLSKALKDDALTVPASAVFTDDEGETHYVYKFKKDAKPEKAGVKVGRTLGDRKVIEDGLAEGDEILTSKP